MSLTLCLIKDDRSTPCIDAAHRFHLRRHAGSNGRPFVGATSPDDRPSTGRSISPSIWATTFLPLLSCCVSWLCPRVYIFPDQKINLQLPLCLFFCPFKGNTLLLLSQEIRNVLIFEKSVRGQPSRMLLDHVAAMFLFAKAPDFALALIWLRQGLKLRQAHWRATNFHSAQDNLRPQEAAPLTSPLPWSTNGPHLPRTISQTVLALRKSGSWCSKSFRLGPGASALLQRI